MTRDRSSPPPLEDESSSARSLWLLLSLVAHAAVALLAVHRPLIIAAAYALTPRTSELATPELDIESPRAPLSAPLAEPVERSSEPPRPAAAVSHRSRVVAASAAPHAAAAPTAPATPSVGAPASPPRFVLAVGHASPAALGTVIASATSAAPVNPSTAEPGAAGTDAPFAEAAVDTPARLLRGDAPAYTREAEAAGVEAELPLEIVIDRNGAVTSARALRAAGYGLDAAALRGIAEYRFVPARRNGVPVAVRMHWRIRFQLR